MNDLTNSIAVFGRPYSITRSRLGAITKVYQDRYICDLPSMKELFQAIGEKLSGVPDAQMPKFSFLISFSDQTHRDGVTADLLHTTAIPIGKQTERVVMRWSLSHKIDDTDNDVSITVRLSNPVNPLMFLQAALSRSPSDIDNVDFEMGSTCVTVDGAPQSFADEVFLRVTSWIAARNKPHSFLSVHEIYGKYEWLLDQLSMTLFPFLIVLGATLSLSVNGDSKLQLTALPLIICAFLIMQGFARRLNGKMARWAERSKHMSLFQLTNGDCDSLAKMAAGAKNSSLKLIASASFAFLLNVAAGVFCWWLIGV